MLKNKIWIISLFIAYFTFNVNAQDSFERLYTSDRSMITVDMVQTGGEGYLILSTVPVQSSIDSAYVNVTKLNPKGDVDWSMDYSFEGDENLLAANLVLLERDSFAFSLVEGVSGLNKIICKAAPSGELVYAKTYGNPAEDGAIAPRLSALAIRSDQSLVFASTTNSFIDPNAISSIEDIYIAFLDTLGNLIQANILGDSLYQFNLADVDTTINNGLILAGTLPSLPAEADQAFLIKLDSLGNVEWNRRFSDVGATSSSIRVQQIIPTPDTGYVAVGSLVDSDLTNNGLLLKFDSLGREQLAIRFEMPSVSRLRFENVTLAADGDFVITGKGIDLDNDSTFVVLIKMDALGNIQWQNKFNTFSGQLNDATALVNTKDNGYALATSGETMGSELIPYLVKTSPSGSSSCEDTISVNLLPPTLRQDTFSLDVVNVDTLIERQADIEDFNAYTVPTLSLEVPPPFCEDEPIFWTFDATTEGAVSYEWSTGETTDSITVMEEGQYIVDVRIETDICFNLCDTAVISTMGPPMVELADVGNYCRDGFTTLAAFPDSPVDSVVWSTGEMGFSIEVSEVGTYSATVYNRCGEGSSMLQVVEIMPAVTIEVVENTVCEGGQAILVANSPEASSFTWSTGATTDTIFINSLSEAETYSVSVNNICGESSDEVILEPIIPEVTVDLVQDSICLGGLAILAATTSNATSLLWSTGSTEDAIIVDQLNEPTTFSATASNACGESIASTELSPNPPVAGILVVEDSICTAGDIILSVTGINILDFEWSIPNLGSSTSDTIILNSEQLPNIFGETQTISLTANNNCGSTIVEQEINCPIPEPCIQVPNVFTPNNDSVNDTFQAFIDPACSNLVNIRLLKIYNRWGQLVYENNGDQAWDGRYQGDLSPSDVYVYYIEAENIVGEIEMFNGDVTLIR